MCSSSAYRRLAYKIAIDFACRSRARTVEEEFRIKCRHRHRPQNGRNRPAALRWSGPRPLVCCPRIPILVDPKHLHPPDGAYVSGECCSRAQHDLRHRGVSVCARACARARRSKVKDVHQGRWQRDQMPSLSSRQSNLSKETVLE